MAFSVTNIGTVAATITSTPITITYAGSNVSAVIIFVCAYETSAVTGTVTDNHSVPNTYTSIQSGNPNASSGNGVANCYYAKNAALSTNDVITYTQGGGGTPSKCMSACYVTGGDTVAPLDTAVTNKATGSSTTPSVVGGTAGASGELNFGVISAFLGSATTTGFVQASGFATPLIEIICGSASHSSIDGGNEVNAGTAGLTYNPTITTHPWVAFIQAFKALSGTPHSQTITVTCTSTTSFLKAAGKTVAAICTSTTSVLKAVAHTVAVTCTSSTAVLKRVGKKVTATCTSTTSFLKSVGKGVAATCTSSTAVLKGVGKTILATCTSATTVLKGIGKTIAATCTSATTIATAAAHTFFVTVSVTCTTAVSLVAQIISALTRDITATDILQLPINCVLAGDQPEPGPLESEIAPIRTSETTVMVEGGKMGEPLKPAKVRTDNRGYD